MRDLVPLLLSTFHMTLYGAGAAPASNETEIEMKILLSEEQKRIIYGSGIITHNAELVRRWPNGRIPYYISRDPSSHEVIKKAMKIIEENTCVRFVPRVDEYFHVNIEDGIGCSAHVGRVASGKSELTLGKDCLRQSCLLYTSPSPRD